MLFKLSIKNIKKSFKDYAIYFLTLILGVAIFYVFNAIDSQTAMMSLSKSTSQMIKLMNQLLSSISIFVSIILGFLIIYASRFLIKRRNKEFGLYLILGMSKRKISTLLFLETLLVGIISLVIGLILGVIASQFMSIIVANMFDADMTKFQFTFSQSACTKSVIYFGIMYLLVMIFNTISINKCKLIDLLHSNKKAEKVKIKNLSLCVIILIISCVILGYSYSLVSGVEKLQNAQDIVKPILLGAISTFFIFWSLSGLMLKIVMSMKNIYYKNLNSFTLRQVSSKINTTVFSMTVICLMLFITLGVLTTSISMKDSLNTNIKKFSPMDFQIGKIIVDQNELSEVEIMENKKEMYSMNIREMYTKMNIDIDRYIKNSVSFNTYKVDNITYKYTLGKAFDDISKKYIYIDFDAQESVMTISEYNKVAKIFNNETFTLNNDEYIIVANVDSYCDMRNQSLKKETNLEINGRYLKPKYNKCQNGNVELASQKLNQGIIIVPDNLLNEDQKYKEYLMGNYNVSSKEEKYNTEKILFDTDKYKQIDYIMTFDTKIEITEGSTGLGAIVTFIGLYLGIIFLISSSAILALKELSESSDNKERFKVLRKIGTDEKMLNQALFRQIGIFFLFPLTLAIIHSIFGMKFILAILSVMGIDLVSKSTIFTYLFLLVIYGAYFIITYLSSKNIIKESR